MSTTVTTHERPGVYSQYDASSIVSGGSGGKAVALIAKGGQGDGSQVYPWYTYAQAVEQLGSGQEMTELVRLLFLNGAAAVYGISISQDSQYADAIAVSEGLEEIKLVVCDSTELEVQQALRESVERASKTRMERIAVVGAAAGEGVSELVARAGELNAERVVLVAPAAVDDLGAALSGVRCAAAAAGAIAAQSDPAVPLAGAELAGLSGLTARFADTELDALVRGGVTVLENVGGQVSVVRGITTRTKTGAAQDTTWRELSTILIIDDVIPGIRTALRAKFPRAKNTAQSRSAIRTQVILELENRLNKEIITDYEDVTVTAVEDNPTACLVEFAFTVTHGLNQIWLSAHISV